MTAKFLALEGERVLAALSLTGRHSPGARQRETGDPFGLAGASGLGRAVPQGVGDANPVMGLATRPNQTSFKVWLPQPG
jgi:hypothetical protein